MKQWTVLLPEELIEKIKILFPKGFRSRFLTLVIQTFVDYTERVGRGQVLDQLFSGNLDPELQDEFRSVLGLPDEDTDPDLDR